MMPHLKMVLIEHCQAADWTTTRHSKKEYQALFNSIQLHGVLQPIAVRETIENDEGHQLYETIDGAARLEILESIGAKMIPVSNYGRVSRLDAHRLHLQLNLTRGRPDPEPLADALEAVLEPALDDDDRAQEEKVLKSLVPIPSRDVGAMIERLRRRAAPAPMEHNPDAPEGWVTFRFKVDPDAAYVCDQALSVVEKTTGCQRPVAFERICADHLAGPVVGRQA